MAEKYILACDSGWRHIREFSLELAGRKIPSTVIIKGFPDKKVRRMITKHDGINNIFVPEKGFTPFLFIYIFLNIFSGKQLLLFASKEKTYKRMVKLQKIFKKIKVEKKFPV